MKALIAGKLDDEAFLNGHEQVRVKINQGNAAQKML